MPLSAAQMTILWTKIWWCWTSIVEVIWKCNRIPVTFETRFIYLWLTSTNAEALHIDTVMPYSRGSRGLCGSLLLD